MHDDPVLHWVKMVPSALPPLHFDILYIVRLLFASTCDVAVIPQWRWTENCRWNESGMVDPAHLDSLYAMRQEKKIPAERNGPHMDKKTE